MLSRYAELETGPNSISLASKNIMNFYKQIQGNEASESSSAATSGIAPKNEYEEFNSNLGEISTFILELKTYVQDSIKNELTSSKEFILSTADKNLFLERARAIVEAQDAQSGQARDPEEIDMDIHFVMEDLINQAKREYEKNIGKQTREQSAGEYMNLLEREAARVGVPKLVNKVNLFGVNVNETPSFISGSGRRLYGGGEAEQTQINEAIAGLMATIEEDKTIYNEFLELEKQIQTNKPGTQEREEAEQAFSEKIDDLRSAENEDYYPDFPDTVNVLEIGSYFKKKIDSEFQDIKALKEQLKMDIHSTGQAEYADIEPTISADVGAQIARLQDYLDRIDGMDQSEFKSLKKAIPSIIFAANKKPAAKKNLQGEIDRLTASIPGRIEKQQIIKRGLTEEELIEQEKQTLAIQETQEKELLAIETAFNEAVAEIDERLKYLKSEEDRTAALAIAQRREEAALKIQIAQGSKLEIKRAKEELALLRQARADAIEQERLLQEELERAKREKAALIIQKKVADKKVIREAKAELERLKKQERIKQEEEQRFTDLSSQLQERKALGKVADSVPRINPIISILSKLSNLISKTNILFNSKIKKNISLLDRLDVEDMAKKFNAVVDNFNQVNHDFIVVSIDNGKELLNQVVNALNKLSLDVSNSIQGYTKSLRGGSRHFNNHLQHYKNVKGGQRLMMNQNPHVYKYML